MMNNKYINGIKEIKADDELKNKIIDNIKQNSSRQVSHFFTFRKAITITAIACIVTLFISAGISYFHNDNGTATTETGKPNIVESIFKGFVITAYATDGTPVEVTPDVDFPLGKYNMFMSSVPGFPVKIVCDEADSIKLTVTDGNLLLWTPPASKVINKGKELEIKSGDTVYWSPMDETNSNSVATACELLIEAYKGNEDIGSNTIKIGLDDSNMYTARLSE